jgi:hypothetical protein
MPMSGTHPVSSFVTAAWLGAALMQAAARGVWPAPSATACMNPMTAAYVDGRLYMRVQDRIACYELRRAHAHAAPQAATPPKPAPPGKKRASPSGKAKLPQPLEEPKADVELDLE